MTTLNSDRTTTLQSCLEACSHYYDEVNAPISDLFVPKVNQKALVQAGRIASLFREEYLRSLFPSVPKPLPLIFLEFNQETRKIVSRSFVLLELAESPSSCIYIPSLQTKGESLVEYEGLLPDHFTKFEQVKTAIEAIANSSAEKKNGDVSLISSLWNTFLEKIEINTSPKDLEEKALFYQQAYNRASNNYIKWTGVEGKIAQAEESVQQALKERQEGPEVSLRILQEYFNILGRIYSEENDESQLSAQVAETYATEDTRYRISLRSYQEIVFKVLSQSLCSSLLNEKAEEMNDNKEVVQEKGYYFSELYKSVAKLKSKRVVMRKDQNQDEIRKKYDNAFSKINASLEKLYDVFKSHTEKLNEAIQKHHYLLDKKKLYELKFGLISD